MKKHFLALALSAFLAAGCSPKYYSANPQNVPLISEKGQYSLNANAGTGGQLGVQGAIGVTNTLAIQGNAGIFIPDEVDGNRGSGSLAELGVGYYRPVTERFVFEAYGLFGVGRVENHLPSTTQQYPETTGDIYASMVRYGIQPNIGFVTKYFTIAVSSRLVFLDYYNIHGDLMFDNQDQVTYLNNNRSNFLFEPALTIRGGLEKIKLQFQIGSSFNLTNSNFRQDVGFAMVGLNFNLR